MTCQAPFCGDEGRLCDGCEAQEAARWARYFGQDHGTREEQRARLEAMRPPMPREADYRSDAEIEEDAP